MKQIVQNLKTGETSLESVPVPKVKKNHVLIQTTNTLVSLGTEKMLVNFGKANYFQKARQQPDKVKQAIEKIKTDGLKPTVDAIFRKLDQPLPLGYCNVGKVIGVGESVNGFSIGDRVVSNGHHAEVVQVPKNIVELIPENVTDEEATFTIVGAIGLQGIRLLNPTFGETIVVFGLGLIGLISAQLLKANGCNVIGIDFDESKLKIANSYGIKTINSLDKNTINLVHSMTGNIGADGVLITASAKTNSIVCESAQMCRQRGRVILVGVVGLELNRSDFYEKEISFQVSCSYGPGRYDSAYENKGLDYPIGHVRWTEKRNFNAVLNALAKGTLKVEKLVTERVKLDKYQRVYDDLENTNKIASIIQFEARRLTTENDIVTSCVKSFEKSKGAIGIIGAGNFTSSTVLPCLKNAGMNIDYIASSNGLTGSLLAKKYKIPNSTTNYSHILNDDNVEGVVITTRHDLHAEQVLESLRKNKHVFVEKPLALNKDDIIKIENAHIESGKTVTVGFNRRFSKFSIKAKNVIGDNPGSINVIASINAGHIPEDHWTQDMNIGGGRIVGEGCHFIDLISFFTSSEIDSVCVGTNGTSSQLKNDNATILLKYKSGSLGVINYFSNGNKSYPKERIEIYQNGKNIIIDNFKSIHFYGYREKKLKTSQDKGHSEQFKRWNSMLKNGGPPIIPFSSIKNTSEAALLCIESIKNNDWVNV